MILVDFDAAVARANGYEIVALPDGSRASVPADKAEAARTGKYIPAAGVLKPTSGQTSGSAPYAYNEVKGECGTSYVALNATGTANATLHTGMHLVKDAGEPLVLDWHVAISDNGGNSTQSYDKGDGNTSGRSWVAHARLLHLTRGYAIAGVTGGSWTITTGGWFCYSLGPSVKEYIY